jgi:2-polyprenyl-3-methyl-5-hydroxy-6-metoxy-1,4-benzoquinol methylase
MNAMTLGFNCCFDVAVSFQVIEHMPDVHDFIKQIKQIVKPGGRIFISTPNVPRAKQPHHGNPFHQNEMDYYLFRELMSEEFSSFKILGVVYTSDNPVRSVIQKLPFYRWGVLLKRSSKIKKLANRALDLTSFRVTETNLGKSLDLLAICQNN